jgi:hypothetical protein
VHAEGFKKMRMIDLKSENDKDGGHKKRKDILPGRTHTEES